MKINRILYVEDDTIKYMRVVCFLKSIGIREIESVRNAKAAMEIIEEAHSKGEDFDLIMLDMHYDFYGENDKQAGEKTMNLIREKGIETPIIFCSSQNWKIPGAFGNIFYNERRDWESEAAELFSKLKGM